MRNSLKNITREMFSLLNLAKVQILNQLEIDNFTLCEIKFTKLYCNLS